ncbi:hypothetical protein T01_854 [Trichinella spiralis]|uniref:Uncharacterized protein n=1 Tax=Trichinella spiralis TaxID=6334 RepID=A0A0V0Z1M7_TRISP|nr:hypothetical protein T01_854 [Trichinella spiralis]
MSPVSQAPLHLVNLLAAAEHVRYPFRTPDRTYRHKIDMLMWLPISIYSSLKLLPQLVMTPLGTPNYVAGKPSSRPPRESVGCSVTCTLSTLNAG